ncbi:MAG TPA: hypothetical protein VGH28_21020 [Polyangiaceae bacterium]
MGLVACPFCREMFEQGEQTECPVCGMKLVAFEKLPPRRETHDELGLPIDPAHELLPWTYAGRMRAPIVALALVGVALFFLPWIHMTLPDDFRLSGFTLARRIGWVWGAGVGWLVLVPTVASRRTIAQMRGARVAAAFLSATSLVSCAILLAFPPHARWYKPHFGFEPAFWLTMVVSAVAVALSLKLGGSVESIDLQRGNATGETLH